MTANGADALSDIPTDTRTKALIRRIGQDEDRSERFILHCLGLFEISCQLQETFGERLEFFTKSELTQYEYLPTPLPDGYMRLNTRGRERQYFIEYFDAAVPVRAAIARVEQFSDYADDGEWSDATGTDSPATIFVVQKPTLKKRLTRLIADEYDNDPLLMVVAKDKVAGAMASLS